MKYFFYSFQSCVDGVIHIGNGVQESDSGLFDRNILIENTNNKVVVLFFQEIDKEQCDYFRKKEL